MTTVFVSAGEPSGDVHAAAVIEALRASDASLMIEGIGGPSMARAGARLFGRIERLSAVGLFEAAHTVPRHARLLLAARRRLRAGRYSLAILVDYPGFHLRLAAAAARAGVPVLYYIAPQLWAWGAWRMRSLRARVRHLAVILPFEESFFRARGVRTSFVGHPLLDRPHRVDRDAARAGLGVAPDEPLLGLLPGSRRLERTRLEQPFLDAARWLQRAYPTLRVVVAAAPDEGPSEATGDPLRSDAATVLAAADAALLASGTATLEAALAGVPHVVAYRMHPATFAVARRMVRVRHISLVNLIAGREVVPEFTQRAASAPVLARALEPLLARDSAAAESQRAALHGVRQALGSPGAGRRVARLAEQLLA